MLVWLLVLLLLTLSIYVIYKFTFFSEKGDDKQITQHYTFKIEEE